MGNQQDQSYKDYAYRVIKIQPGSPAEKAGLLEFFDFILYNPELNNGELLSELFFKNMTKEVELEVYNFMTSSVRKVKIVPKKLANSQNYIGADLKFENYTNAHLYVYRLYDVQENSPAFYAELGINIGIDYLIAINDQTQFQQVSQIGDFLIERIGQQVNMTIYNNKTKSLRQVIITPRNDWGGHGILGCHLIQDKILEFQEVSPNNEFVIVDSEDLINIPSQNVAQTLSIQIVEEEKKDTIQIQSAPLAQEFNHSYITPIKQKQESASSEKLRANLINERQDPNKKKINSHSYLYQIESPQKQIQIQNEVKKQIQAIDLRDQTILFHRSDGKRSEFLLINV
ncbi:UNKNOWN [Stylonychia lemnae]|uniref:PDZ GRASP-type domain-containing protein n=1 Tax=Stylonychia lemnae TaxID=5949 RepID=A0A078B3Q3_STYLE|nr:UNKNOWN [Stylonychia lemnae]|eukprot:CDW87852.1 UNKNOWN [Stylonychia lemnae]